MKSVEKQAIISVADKTDLVPFMGTLLNRGWKLFATSGSGNEFEAMSGIRVASIADYVELETGFISNDRELIAQLASGLVVSRRSVQLVCVNLRAPQANQQDPRGAVRTDVGGISMLMAAGRAGALTATQPEKYDQVLEQLGDQGGVDSLFARWSQDHAHKEIISHLSAAAELPAF